MNYALVCTDQDAPAGLAGTVFAVGTPLVTKADIKPCTSLIIILENFSWFVPDRKNFYGTWLHLLRHRSDPTYPRLFSLVPSPSG